MIKGVTRGAGWRSSILLLHLGSTGVWAAIKDGLFVGQEQQRAKRGERADDLALSKEALSIVKGHSTHCQHLVFAL